MLSKLRYEYVWPLGAILQRGGLRSARRLANTAPLLVMPLFFLIAFSGSFVSLGDVEGFGAANVVSWMLPWAALQGCAFAGIGTGAFTAEDLEGGFYDRLFLAPIPRVVLIGGLQLLAAARALIPLTAVTIVAIPLGADFPSGFLAVAMLYLAGIGTACILSLLSLSFVYKFKTQRILTVSQVLIFVALFLSIGQAPIRFMQGWLPYVARVNPFTNIIRMSRQGLIGDVTWMDTWPGLIAIAGFLTAFGFLALRNLRRYID